MLSKGGKIIYACARCRSHEIERCGTVARNAEDNCFEILGMYNHRDDHYYCPDCGHFDLWTSRLKLSRKKPIPYVKVDLIMPEDDPRRAYRTFHNFESYQVARIPLRGEVDFSML